MKFRTGAFVSGTPIVPCYIKFNYTRFNPAWSCMHVYVEPRCLVLKVRLKHIAGLGVQMYNSAEIHYLPAYVPNKAEAKEPRMCALVV